MTEQAIFQAAGRLAVHAMSAHTIYAPFDEAGPHASIDATCIGTLDNEEAERTRRRRHFSPVALERDDRDLEAERAERIADLLESGRNVSGRLQARCGGELAAEILARFAEPLRPATSGNLLHQEADQLGQAPVGKFDPFELRGDAIDLGRGPAPGPRRPPRRSSATAKNPASTSRSSRLRATFRCMSREAAASAAVNRSRRPRAYTRIRRSCGSPAASRRSSGTVAKATRGRYGKRSGEML